MPEYRPSFDNRDVIVVLTDEDRLEAARVTAHANKRENWHEGMLWVAKDNAATHLGCKVIYSVLVEKGKPARHMAFWLPEMPDTWPGPSLVEPIGRLYGFTGPIETWRHDCQRTEQGDDWSAEPPRCVLTLHQAAENLAG